MAAIAITDYAFTLRRVFQINYRYSIVYDIFNKQSLVLKQPDKDIESENEIHVGENTFLLFHF